MRNRLPGVRRTSERGFTLLEILVAFSLMALIVTVLLRIFAGGVQGIGLAEDYARATSIAESVVARVGADIEFNPATLSGSDEGERYKWQLALQQVDGEAMAAPGTTGASSVGPALPIALWRISAVVEWADGGKPRSIRMDTLRVGPLP